MYRKYIKRWLDIILSFIAIIVLWPVMAVIAVCVKVKLGSPVIFVQKRPGLNECIFKMYKFRRMTDVKNQDGKLLPDRERLSPFGKRLRSTSLEGNDIIRQTTKSLKNKGIREVSLIHFYQGCNLFSTI